MPNLPRAGWLAVGAITAALLTASDYVHLPLPASAVLALGAATIVGAALLLCVGRVTPAAFCLAAGTVVLRAALAAVATGTAATALPLPVGSGEWNGEIVDVSSPSGTEQRAFVRIDAPAGDGGWLVYAWLPRHPALVPGDGVKLRGALEPPPDDGPGFAGFLESRGAAGTLKAHGLELAAHGSGAGAAVEQLRWGIDEALSRAIPEPEAGLASGILVGLRERVSRQVAEDFTTTGLTHVVAISGWNIALVAGIATALLRATGLGRRPRSLLVIVAIVTYTILAGAEASVIRAAVMGAVVLVARESGRPSGAAAALGLACWGLLLAEPAMIDDIGLQLSLAATAGLLVLGGPAEAAVGRLTRGRAPRWLGETLGVSLAAQLSTLPLILLHFGRLSLISPLANLLVAPIVPLAMLGAAIGVVMGPLLVGPVVGLALAPLSLGSWLPLALMTRGATLLAGVPLASVELPSPLDQVGAALALAALVAALRATRSEPRSNLRPWQPPPRTGRGRSRKLVAIGAVGALITAGSATLVVGPAPGLRLSVLDIGQGDAILLETADGQRMLVDGGPDPDLLVRRLDERIPVWDRHIDLAVLTHPHEDHAGGLAGLAPRYSISRIAETGMNSEGAGVRELRSAAARYDIGRVRLDQGDTFRLGQARVEVLWPPRHALPHRLLSDGRAINGTSIVLAVSLGQQRVLLTGDLEDDHDLDLLEMIEPGARWDVLKVAHHGSATASGGSLLDLLRPRLAAISVGLGNRYGHPAPDTLARLEAAGSTIWRTDRQGTLAIALDGRPRSASAMVAGPPRTGCPTTTLPPPVTTTGPRDPCYIRPDGGTHQNRSALTAHVHRAHASSAAARDGSGRGGRVPGLSRHARRRRRRPAPGGDSRAPPRRGQGLAGQPSAQGARPRQGRRCLVERGRSPGVGARAHGPPGHQAGRPRCRAVGRRGAHRRAHRDLRRQAGDAAGGLARAALRPMAPTASRVRQPTRLRLRQRVPPGTGPVPEHRIGAGCCRATALGRGRTSSSPSQRQPARQRGRAHRWRGWGHSRGPGGAMSPTPALAYFWGEDAFMIERAAREYAEQVSPPGERMEVWRANLDDDAGEESGSASAAKRRARALDSIEQHLGMAPLFGAGTLVVVRQPAGLLAEKEARGRLIDLVGVVPPGNALCVTDLIASSAKAPAARGALRDAIRDAGGVVQEFKAPGVGRLEPWLVGRAGELGIELQPAAARLLAERVGGHIRESDVDRRRRTELANGELEKLALYRPGGSVSADDVDALVSETIPGSMWAFLDAVGLRAGPNAAALAERLLDDATPLPVLVSQLHRRLRELILVREHLDAGSRPAQIVKDLKLQPFRAQKLAEQAGNWPLRALETALVELLAVDLRSKGIALDGSTLQMSEHIDALSVQTWVARHAASANRQG